MRLYGYFQNEFEYEDHRGQKDSRNSFFLQQLNFFVQKDLGEKWSSFVNFELLNTYSSQRRFGAFNLEEAWVKYRFNKELSVKIGLQIPVFNRLNQIKNRTPLLPYVIRPLVYETAFGEFIQIEEFLPTQAFVQAYGNARLGRIKIDHALYLGNSPNTSRWEDGDRSGGDTTATFLVGGRLGLRLDELELGLSVSRDEVNFFRQAENLTFKLGDRLVDFPPGHFKQIDRYRLGGDLFYAWGPLSMAAEIIKVAYDDDVEEIGINKLFYYGTLEYHPRESLSLYLSYSFNQSDVSQAFTEPADGELVPLEDQQDLSLFPPDEPLVLFSGTFDIKVPSIGCAYHLSDRIVAKAQFAPVEIDGLLPFFAKQRINFYAIALSTFF